MWPEGKLLSPEPFKKLKACLTPCITSVGLRTPKNSFNTSLLMAWAQIEVRQAIAKTLPKGEICPRTKRARSRAKVTADSTDRMTVVPNARNTALAAYLFG
jgi:hypothetical protein